MAIKFKYEKQEDIPKEHVALFVEKDEGGKKIWVADVEGVIDSSRLDEFRNTNRGLQKQIAELNDKFEGIDPVAARALSDSVGGLKPEEVTELLKQGKNIDKVVEARTKTMREEQDRMLTKERAEKERIQRRLEEVEINQATVAEATKRGLKPTAILDITSRARTVFKLSPEGKPVAYEPDGKTVRYGKDALTPMTISDWVEDQVTSAPHLFEESKGGGAGGGGGDKGHDKTGPNPFKKETLNMTEQMKLMKADPAKARRLAAEAGVRLPG